MEKWTGQGEQLILVRDWNIDVLEVNTWMETQGLVNTIFNLCGYSYVTITCQRSKVCHIDGIFCIYPLAENRGGGVHILWKTSGRPPVLAD